MDQLRRTAARLKLQAAIDRHRLPDCEKLTTVVQVDVIEKQALAALAEIRDKRWRWWLPSWSQR